MPDLRIFDGSKIEIYNTDNTNSGTINMIGSALKLQGQSSNILISSGNNLIFASNATIGGQNSILTLGNSGDTIALDNTGVTYRLGTINNHNDVLINSPSDGQLLYWSSGKIVNANNSQVAILNKEYPTLQIDHPTSGGNSGIVFNSRSNYGSDKAFILYQDNSTQVRSGGTEASRLIIGVYNDDSDNNSSDELWFEGCQRIVYNVGAYDSDIAGIIGTVASGTNATHEWRINDSKVASIDSTGFIVNKNLYVGYTASASNPEIVVGNGTSTGTSYLKFRTLGTEGWLQYGQGSNVFSFKNHSGGWANVSANTFTSNVATGTAPFTISSTTAVTNLNADMVDGIHASDLYNNTAIKTSQKTNLAAGWYTIAVVKGDGTAATFSRAVALFGITDVCSSRHQEVIFYATHMFGNNSSNTITVVSQSSYNITPFRYIRIKENGVYDGAALQVYIDDSTNIVQAYILSDNIQTDGWILKNWIPDATDPGNVNLYTNFTEKVKVDLDVSQQGGIITTGSVWSGGSLFANKGAKDANDLPSTWSDGMYFSQVYNNNFPCAYGTLLSIMRAKGNDGVQLLMEWKESDATSGSLFYRNKRDVGEDVWSPWSKVWSDTNHGSGSGLNADLLDGNHASAFALAGHNHDSSYSLITHDHNKFTKLSALNSSGTTLGTYNTISFNDEIKLRAGTNITLSINSNEITIDGTHNHDSIYSKKSGDTFTGPVNMSNLLTFGSGQDIAADAVSGTEPTQGIKFSADSDLYYIFMRTDNTNDKNGLIIQLGDNTDDYFQIEQVSPAGEASPTKLLKISESEGINTFTKLYTEQPITTKFATRSYLFKNVTYYYNGTANVTGTVKITMPGSWDATMMNIKIIGYDYSTNGAWELVVSGYNYDSSQNWLNCSAEIRGNAPFNQVRFAYDGSKNCLLLGTTSTVWQYPNLIVKEVAASFNTSTLSTWGSGWTASLITDESGITKIVTPNLRKTWHSENDGSESGLDADLIDGLHANVLGERYEINIGNSAGTRRWVRLATLDGLNSTGGANLEFILSGTGDFGSANRGIIFVQAGQRDTVISVMAYGLNFENTQDIVELYYKNLGSYKYEIWAKFADYNFMHYMTVLSKTNATINIDNIGTTAPTSPVSIAINKLWNSSNHGHGSGLDADTIDGKHSSDLVLKTGDTLTGTLTLKQDQFYESNSVSGINVNNSDIIGLNGLYFNDLVDSAGEGINFYRNTNIWDSLYLKNGEIYVHFNRLKGTNMSGVKVWHENNDGPNSGLDADTLDGQHASAFALVNHNHDSSYATIGHDHNKFTKLHALNSSETDIANSPYTAASSSDAIKLKAGTNITLSMSSNIVTIDATHNHDSVYAPNHTHSTLTINTNSDINNVAGGSYNTSSNVTATMFKPDQNINTNSTPQFARLGIGVAADSTYQLKLANGTILSGVSDSSSAVGFTFNTQSLSTSGAKIISLRNNGSERVYVDKDGNVSTSGIILSNRNKWQFAYSSVTLATASITPTPYDFLNGTIDNSFTLVDDTNNFDSILKSADYYIARLHTNVYCSSSKTISLSGMYADDTWAIYVNGNFIDGSTASCQTKNVSFTIPAGFSTIDIYFYEHVSTQSLKWTGTGAQKISDQVDYMFVENTFAPVLINSQPKMVAARITFGIGKSSATWTHNRNWSDYIVLLSTNSPEPHVYYSNKTSNSITINLDDEAYEQVIVDVILVMLESITSIMA